MPLFPPSPARGRVPLLNSACPWASSADDLAALYFSPHTSAVTVRTSTLNGFEDDASKHQVAFYGPGADSSSNCYGYSPYPLSTYLSWLRPLIQSDLPRKQVILSITGTIDETSKMLDALQAFADEVGVVIAAEFNASCPNFRGHPPPAYVESELQNYFRLLASKASPNLKVGMKLPPYTYDAQFDILVDTLRTVSPGSDAGEHPIAFLTATNTLGHGLVFGEQIRVVTGSTIAQGAKVDLFALPDPLGGLAGAAVHPIALGNVYKLSTLLNASPDVTLRTISLIGVGGVADAAGVERFRRVGAAAVACATALGRDGVTVFAKIAESSLKL